MMRSRLTLMVALAAVLVAGCGSTRDEGVKPRECVRISDINDFDVLDEEHLIVEARASDEYLFTLEKGCSGLSFATGIRIDDRSTRVCGDGFSYIAFDEMSGLKRCRVIGLDPVEDVEEARRLIEARRQETEDVW